MKDASKSTGIMLILIAVVTGLVVVLILWPKSKDHSSNKSSNSMPQTINKSLVRCEDIARQDFGSSPRTSIAYDTAFSACQKMYGTN